MNPKFTKLFLSFVLVTAVFLPYSHQVNAQELKVFVDGEKVDFPVDPIIVNGRTLVPLRAIFEAMGAIVTWNQAERIVIAEKNDIQIHLPIGSKTAIVDGESINLDEPAIIHKGSTMVPLRFLAESFGGRAKWNQESYTATIIQGTEGDSSTNTKFNPNDPTDRDCSEFDTQDQAQKFYEEVGGDDPHRLDRDGDGIVCESLEKE